MPGSSSGHIQRRLLTCGSRFVIAFLFAHPGAAAAQASLPSSTTPEPQIVPIGQQPPVHAATAADQHQEQAIVVTGSRIPRPNLTAISPLTVINSQEVKFEGAVLTENLVNSLPQARPDQGAFLSNGAIGTSTVDLRGLGAPRTLVLINGRRFMPGDPEYPAPDINAVPSSLIKRVEVLTGGASSVYGSDAVAGVVNFILETRLEGLRLDGQVSFYQHINRDETGLTAALRQAHFPFPKGNTVDGGNQDMNAAIGHGFFGGRGHVTLYAGYRNLSKVTQDERDYSSCTAQVEEPDEPIFCGGSSASAEGNFFTNFGRLRLGAGRTFVRGPRTLFNFAPYNYYQRPGRRITAGGFADVELSDALKPYLEVMFMDDRTVAQVAPSANFGSTASVNCDNPLLSAQQVSRVCFPGNFVGETPIFDDDGNVIGIDGSPTPFVDPVTGSTYYKGVLIAARRNVEGGPRQEQIGHKNLRIIGGFKGDLGRGVSYDASYLFGSVRKDNLHTNDLSVLRLNRAIDVVTDPATGQPVCRSVLTGEDPNCVPWDVFILGGVTPEAAAYVGIPARLSGTVRQRVATAFVTAELAEWGIRSPWAVNGPALNVGIEYRRDTLDLRPDEHYQAADLTGLGQPILPIVGSTTVKELFGELRVPILSRQLVDDLTVEVGYRQSWNTNGQSSFSTDSYKIAAELTPVRGVKLRASQQRAVRAPNIQELFAPPFASGFGVDPCAGVNPEATAAQCALTGVTAAQYGHVLTNPTATADFAFGYNAIGGGNLGLQPETATTRTIGLVLQPRFLPAFSATIDWFDIQLTGAIAEIGPQTILQTCLATGDPSFCTRVHRDMNGSLWLSPQGYVDDRKANIGSFKVRGIDVGSTYTQGLGRFGSANAGFIGTWTDRFTINNGGLSTPYDCAGLYGNTCGYPLPRWRHTARVTWAPKGGLSLSLNWRFIGKSVIDKAHPDVPRFVDFYNPVVAKIGPRSFFDLAALFTTGSNYVLRFGVNNIFDKEPPIIASGTAGACGNCNGNTFTQLYDPLGRYIFAGVTMNLNPF